MQFIYAVLMATALSLFVVSCTNIAKETTSTTDTIATGIIFTNKANKYEVLSGVVLIPQLNRRAQKLQFTIDPDAQSELAAEHKQQVEQGDVVGSIGSWLLVGKHSATAQRLAQSSVFVKPTDKWYVRNLADNTIGVVSGELYIHLDNTNQAQTIAREYTLRYQLLLPDSSIALMQAAISDDFLDKVKKLRADSRVVSLEIRVITELPELAQ